MFVEIIKRATIGIAVGGLYTFIVLTFLMLHNIESSISVIWINMLGSFFIGIYYGLASFIFEKTNWTPLKRTVVHFSISIVVFFTIAISINWIPFTLLSIIINSGIFLLIYFSVWTGYSLYYKKVATTMNDHLQKKD